MRSPAVVDPIVQNSAVDGFGDLFLHVENSSAFERATGVCYTTERVRRLELHLRRDVDLVRDAPILATRKAGARRPQRGGSVASRQDLDAAERNIGEAEARIQRQRALVGRSHVDGHTKLACEAEDLLARMLITLEQLNTVRLLIAADLLREDLR